MPEGDQTGPKEKGPKTGRGLGLAVGNVSGQSTNENRPYDGRGNGYGNRSEDNYGPGRNNTRTYENRQSIGIEEKVTGPGGHTPDKTGPHGRGNGPGKARADGSGLEIIANIEKYIISNDKNYNTIAKEYSSIYSQYKEDFSNTSGLKNVIMQAHNTAVKKGYKGNQRKEYVKNEVKKYSKNQKPNPKNSKTNSKKSKSSPKKAA